MSEDHSSDYQPHGVQCHISSNQNDWCEECQHDWQAGAFLRFSRGLTILTGAAHIDRNNPLDTNSHTD